MLTYLSPVVFAETDRMAFSELQGKLFGNAAIDRCLATMGAEILIFTGLKCINI